MINVTIIKRDKTLERSDIDILYAFRRMMQFSDRATIDITITVQSHIAQIRGQRDFQGNEIA